MPDRIRWHHRLAGSAVVALAVGCGPETSVPTRVRPALGVYSEFLATSEVSSHLTALADRGAALSLAVPDARIGDAELAELLRAAEDAGVPVRLWLVLDRAEGYWPNETNVRAYDAAVGRLLDWLEAEELLAEAVVFDLEPAFAYSEELRAAFATSDLGGIVELTRSHLDPSAFAIAEAGLGGIVDRLHAAGLDAECVTYPQVIDDAADGDRDLEDALDIPVSGVAWDEVSLMVYETVFAEATGGAWAGPTLVRSYAEGARELFGDRATIALGLVGTAGIFEPTGPVYEDPALLADDVAAALAEGIGRVEIYSLDGMLGLGGPAPWLEATVVVPVRPTGLAPGVRTAHNLAAALDAQLGAP